MLSIEELSKRLRHTSLDGLAKDLGVSRHSLFRIRNCDNTAPYNAIKALSLYFEEIEIEE